jgi:hypothetical protein
MQGQPQINRRTFEEQRTKAFAVETVKENSSRHAIVYAKFNTEGWYGQVESERPFIFGMNFVDMPNVAYGYSLATGELEVNNYPMCFGGVSSWMIDAAGFYVGAWPFIVVQLTGQVDPYTITHSFTFTGVAQKQVPIVNESDWEL